MYNSNSIGPALQTLCRTLLLGLTLGPAAALHAWAYQFVDLGVDVSPTDINDNSTVVGWRPVASGRVAIRTSLRSGLFQSPVSDDPWWLFAGCMIRKPLSFAERQVLAGLQAFNLTKLAGSSGRLASVGRTTASEVVHPLR